MYMRMRITTEYEQTMDAMQVKYSASRDSYRNRPVATRHREYFQPLSDIKLGGAMGKVVTRARS
jgi:hypothetical protein